MGKYAESRKRREKRRRLAKRYYVLSIRDTVKFWEYAWIENNQIKSKKSLIQFLIKIINDENLKKTMEICTTVQINTWHFSGNRGLISSERLILAKEKTIEEHIKDYIFEQRCMIRCGLPYVLVEMLYDFL